MMGMTSETRARTGSAAGRFGHRQSVILGVVLATAVVAVGVCDRPSAHLRAMRSEPVVNSPSGVEEAERWEFDYGTTQGEPSYPEVLVLYRPASGVAAPDATVRLIEVALADGWEPLRQWSARLQAYKTLPDGEDVSLDVYWYHKPDPVTDAEIGVHIRLGAH